MSTSMLLILPLAGFLTSLAAAWILSASTKARAPGAVQKFIAAIGFSALFVAAFSARGDIGAGYLSMPLFGLWLNFGLTQLSWYFVAMVAGITLVTVLFSLQGLRDDGEYPFYYTWLFSKTFGMLGVLLSADMLTFFIMWEVMSWCTYFLLQQGHEKAKRAAGAYLVYAVTAGMILLAGLLYVYFNVGSFDFRAIQAAFSGFGTGRIIIAMLLVLVPMLIEAAAYPVHWWLPSAYANTETGISAYLAAISTRIGIYGMTMFLFAGFGLSALNLVAANKYVNANEVLMIIGAFTMVVPTFTALFQHDAKELMTWHSIGQGGYMIVGIASSTTLGIAGGLFHVFNHMTYVSLILFSIAAVEYRTGTTNLNKLGGLIKKQPIAYLGLLFGIIGLAGIPPMNGFVSKWLIYRALILSGHPFIALAAFIATLGTILSVYKLIHNMFLGQLPERYNDIKEVGWGMRLPIIFMMAVVWLTGAFPGTVLAVIADIQRSLGLEPIAYSAQGVAAEAGQLNMLVINIIFIGALFVSWLIYLAGGKRKHIGQYDNYAAGHFLDKSISYNYNYNFYAGMDHIFEGALHKPPVKRAEQALAAFVSGTSDFVRRMFTGNITTYAAYVVAAAVVILLVLGGGR